ncbi:MAG: outer membrane lipoprotein-sorting protein [Deltaproteobacteria bacterium]|nr:outer membrane lipoprotein-sorting protein [Deltaproteobacteria bacterium]
MVRNKILLVASTVIVVTGVLMSTPARSETPGDLLKKVDDVEFAQKDMISSVTMTLIDSGGKEKVRKSKMWQLGDSKRMFKFLKPANVKNVGFLDLGEDVMYLYMPAFKKIRRIAGHIKNDTFMGTDFTYDDMSSTRMAEDYKAVKATEEGDHNVLELVPKDPDDKDYSKVIVRARKSDHHIVKVDFYDKAGKLWKVMTREQYKPVGKYQVAHLMEMKDLKKSHATRMTMEQITCDTGLKESFFSQRQLKRRK